MLKRMGRARAGVVMVGLAGAGLLALALVDCAEPTQIVIEVRSDACPPATATKKEVINQTGISVGSASDIDDRAPSALRDGCERAPGVGTLTIYPSGDKDSEVAIKVVAGVTTTPDRCVAPGYVGCIAHRRIMRFKPNESQRVIVRLSLACLNRTCPGGTTCDEGVCKNQDDILDDGGTRADAALMEAGKSEGGTTLDAGVDACMGCKGDCDQQKCSVDCTGGCAAEEQCAPNLPCDIKCPTNGKCADIRCTTSERCTVTCGVAGSCGKVTCNAKACDVTCTGMGSCAAGVYLDASTTGDLHCNNRQSCVPVVSCGAPTCKLYCNPNTGNPGDRACPQNETDRPCTGGCANWTTSPLP
jgi:hypothetical protein